MFLSKYSVRKGTAATLHVLNLPFFFFEPRQLFTVQTAYFPGETHWGDWESESVPATQFIRLTNNPSWPLCEAPAETRACIYPQCASAVW